MTSFVLKWHRKSLVGNFRSKRHFALSLQILIGNFFLEWYFFWNSYTTGLNKRWLNRPIWMSRTRQKPRKFPPTQPQKLDLFCLFLPLVISNDLETPSLNLNFSFEFSKSRRRKNFGEFFLAFAEVYSPRRVKFSFVLSGSLGDSLVKCHI